jgi:hypothetical protein
MLGASPGLTLEGKGSGALTCLRMTARGVSASKGTRPVTISYRMMPSE